MKASYSNKDSVRRHSYLRTMHQSLRRDRGCGRPSSVGSGSYLGIGHVSIPLHLLGNDSTSANRLGRGFISNFYSRVWPCVAFEEAWATAAHQHELEASQICASKISPWLLWPACGFWLLLAVAVWEDMVSERS
jgi:hypothetical protein